VTGGGGGLTGTSAGPVVGPATNTGMQIEFRRRDNSRRILELDWHLPVWAPDLVAAEVEAGRTTTGGGARTALSRERAFVEIRKEGDYRPLLVLRECEWCKGSDDAFLSRKLDNEKTALLARWFRCVRLPNDVLKAEHPFHNLFGADHPPHLFLCDWDGSNPMPLDGQQSQKLLWESMVTVLERSYAGNPETAVKQLLKLLNEYDFLDYREDELKARLDDELVKNGAKSSKVKDLQKQLAEVAERRTRTAEREAKLSDLGLRKPASDRNG
jgi:hypothetical protein